MKNIERKYNRRTYLLFYSLLMPLMAVAQSESPKSYPVVGERCPNFVLSDFHDRPSKTVSLDSLSGRHFILYFWNEGCIPCIQSMPKLNEIQQKYKEKLEIILVGGIFKGRDIRGVYEKLRRKFDLDLNSSYDSLIKRQFQNNLVPYTVWVDDRGIVKWVGSTITDSQAGIEAFLADSEIHDRDLSFDRIVTRDSAYKKRREFLKEDTGTLFSSTLVKQEISMPELSATYIDAFLNSGMPFYETYIATIPLLYQVAYIGHASGPLDEYFGYASEVILESKDSIKLRRYARENLFHYSLRIPKTFATKNYLMQFMQEDLKRYFGYTVTVEDVEFDRYFLTASETGLNFLRRKSSNIHLKYDPFHIKAEGVSIFELLKVISYTKGDHEPIFNGTGMADEEIINFDLRADFTDFNVLKKALNKYGMDLEKRRIKLQTVVLRD